MSADTWLFRACMLIAVTATSLALAQPSDSWATATISAAGMVTSAECVASLVRRARSRLRDETAHVARRLAIVAFLIAVALPLLIDLMSARFDKHWTPLEQSTMAILRNAALVCSAVRHLLSVHRLSIAIGSVLVGGAIMIGEHAAQVSLALGFVACACTWSALRSWNDIGSRVVERVPWGAFLAMSTIITGIGWLGASYAREAPRVLGEWLPASGGTHEYNSRSIMGIAEGDWAVSGRNAHSTGSIDGQHFLESHLPTIYDVFAEAYGEPRTPRERDRAIALPPEQLLRQGKKTSDAGAALREFSLYRTPPSRPTDTADRHDGALLQVEGRTPLHLTMRAYDRFDGKAWHETPDRDEVCRVQNRNDDATWQWMPNERPAAAADFAETHGLRFGLMRTDRLPLPPLVQRFRLGKQEARGTNRWALEMFRVVTDGVLKLRREIPSGFRLEVTSFLLAHDRLAATSEHDPWTCENCRAYLQVPERLHPTAARFAEAWRELPRGWQQIDAVVQHLRTHYRHDRSTVIADGCDDPVHEFLYVSRRGPDYQFATAAALALRCLGYPTRVVSGLYARPEAFDRQTDTTPLVSEDAHFWAEVRLPDGTWALIEPTPGYDVLRPRETLAGMAKGQLAALLAITRENPVTIAMFAALSALTWFFRSTLRDWGTMAIFRLQHRNAGSRSATIGALLVLERRMSRLALHRPRGATISCWISQVGDQTRQTPEAAQFRSDLDRFRVLIVHALYQPGEQSWPAESSQRVSMRIVDHWSQRRLRHALRQRGDRARA